MPCWELAQLNIAKLLAPIDSPILADFVSELDWINLLAEQSPGFIWRLQSDVSNATELAHPFGDDTIVNMSVWDNVASLHDFTYRTVHAEVMSHRKKWFARMSGTYSVLWWVPQGHRPTTQTAQERLKLITERGPNSEAFSFKQVFEKPS